MPCRRPPEPPLFFPSPPIYINGKVRPFTTNPISLAQFLPPRSISLRWRSFGSMASALRMMGSPPCASCSAATGRAGRSSGERWRSSMAVMSRLREEYRTLRISPGASEREVKKAFRQLALQYHPDVCKGSNCGVQFHRINEAYDVVMRSLRGVAEAEEEGAVTAHYYGGEDDEEMRGMCDSSWDMWEEWMGFEGASTMDFSSHINPYI